MLANTIIAVTSDHGESFGEHGLLLHGSSLYHEQLHVPLILFWDGHIPEGVRPAYTVSNASLPATLLELCQLDNPLLDSEPSLAKWQSAAGPESIATADVEQTDWVQEGSPAFTGMLRSIVQNEWQLIHHEHDGPQLFNLRDDPAELENLSGLERTREIESELGGLLGQDPGRFRGQ
jgi:arylsulfatase A-like enzyme